MTNPVYGSYHIHSSNKNKAAGHKRTNAEDMAIVLTRLMGRSQKFQVSPKEITFIMADKFTESIPR